VNEADRDSHSAKEGHWSTDRAERHLRSLELFGMRFGLDRMRRMMTALGSPERSFQAIHVLGTNGKTSTTRMIAAILERHGLSSGTYTSPHLRSYTERVQVSEHEISEHDFAVAISRAARAAARVNRTLSEEDHVTQFELLTAAAFSELERQEVQVAVIEAGLGGRYDATSVIDARVMVLTNVGLEHTRWLGPTVTDIAAEKLAALKEGATLVLGAGLDPAVRDLAHESAQRCQAQLIEVGQPAGREPWSGPLRAGGSFQRENFALARTAAEAYLTLAGIEPESEAIAAAGADTLIAGRFQIVDQNPLTIFDGAHNPAATSALCESLRQLIGERPLVLVLGVLEDKDAAAMLGMLLPLCERAWFTAPPSARALSPAALQSLARQQGFQESVCEPLGALALEQARDYALARGSDTVLLASGSIYLIGDLLAHVAPLARGARGLCGQEDLNSQRNTTG
jgi:dihydrofolate synthase/folylpolyglutamate synthase